MKPLSSICNEFILGVVLLVQYFLLRTMLERMIPNHFVCIHTYLMATLRLDPLSDDPLQWPRDIRGQVHQCSEQTIKVDKDVLN